MKDQLTVSPLDVLSLYEDAVEEVRRSGRARVVSVSIATDELDPIDVFDAARDKDGEAVLWQLPSEDVALVGIGQVAELSGRGPSRFRDVHRQWQQLLTDAVVVDDTGIAAHPGPGPVALGGFAFSPGSAAGVWDGFGDGRLVLPRVIYGAVRGARWLTFNTLVTEETEPEGVVAALSRQQFGPRFLGRPVGGADFAVEESSLARPTDVLPKERWLAAVERVAADIRQGKLEKAVLARTVRVPLEDGFSVAHALRRLRKDYPETYVFAVAGRHGCFFGATPERIVHLEDGVVDVACLAGSIGRGQTDAEDRRLGEDLLSDPKNVEEHKIVLRSILHGLGPVCQGVVADSEPGLRKLANVQHLYTPVRARAQRGIHVLELVSRIHPTPAIGGHPTDAALDLIRQHERMDRGWYAGPVGWMNGQGEGEFAVGLRSGLVRDGEARLFAGCGIMGDSDPESEYAESELKLRPMLRALEAGAR